MIGKILAFVLALADLSLLALLVTVGDGNVFREAGLATSFLLLGAMAWVVAFFNALYVAFRHGRDWRWILILLVFLWLPALPVVAYSISDFAAMIARRNRKSIVPAPQARAIKSVQQMKPARQVTQRWALPSVNVASLTKSRRRGLLGLRRAA